MNDLSIDKPGHDTPARLQARMAKARHHAEWLALARRHDRLTGAQAWRETTETTLYDFREIDVRHRRLLRHIENGESRELLYALNEGVHGNMGGMGQPVLYARALCGTKHLVEDYVATIARALIFISKAPDSEISHPEKMDFFRRASHCYGRSALLLSGGAGLIYFHHGVVQELVDQNLLPNVISGASAGSAIAAQLGTLDDATLKSGYFTRKRYEEAQKVSMLDALLGRLGDEEIKAAREQVMDDMVPPDITFQEAYEKTGRYINVSISPAEKHQSSRLMNAITAPNVYVRAAVSASCSIPGIMPSQRLYAKGFDGKPRPYLANRRWVDGSLSGDLPVKRLSRLYGVNHYIVSLINPVVVPFIEDVKARRSAGFRTAAAMATLQLVTEGLTTFEGTLHRRGNAGARVAAQLAHLVGMLEQNYLGDINILMQKSDFRWHNTVFRFRDGEIESLVNAGMRRTWPKLPQIHNAALISRTLDKILEDLNAAGMDRATKQRHHQYV